jgi:hypothetical protein
MPFMKPQIHAAIVLAAAFAWPQSAAAQTDFLKVAKVACTPESVTRCTEPGKCTTRAASAGDKTETLIVDFAGKKVTIRKGGDAKPFADVADEQVNGDVRRFVVAESGGSGAKLEASLTRAGKLTLLVGKDGGKAEATCTAES